MRLFHLGCVRFLFANDTLLMEFFILGWRKKVDMFAMKQASSVTEKKTVKDKIAQKKVRPDISLQRIIKMLKSFKINRCNVSIDTGNVQLNALLYPLFYMIQVKTNKSVQINFTNNNELILEIENSLARLSWAYISSEHN